MDEITPLRQHEKFLVKFLSRVFNLKPKDKINLMLRGFKIQLIDDTGKVKKQMMISNQHINELLNEDRLRKLQKIKKPVEDEVEFVSLGPSGTAEYISHEAEKIRFPDLEITNDQLQKLVENHKPVIEELPEVRIETKTEEVKNEPKRRVRRSKTRPEKNTE